MNNRKKISLMLVMADVLIIVMVVVIKSNSTVNIKAKDTVAAANVLVNSDDSLDTFKDDEIKEYITEKEERVMIEEQKAQEEAAGSIVDTSNEVAATVAIDVNQNQNSVSTTPIPDTSYSDVASYAVQFVGNPYVYGGTSLTDGADCSGFVMSVYSNFGVSLPRTASGQSTVGYSVPVDQAQAGDIISYGYNGNVSHSALYIGNNTIVHASTPSLGIRTDSMYIMPIVSVRRVSE